MQYDVDSPAAYLDALQDDWRKARLLALRERVSALAPDWDEGIEYKMLSYSDAAGSVLHINAQKGFVGIYVGDVSKVDPTGEILAGFNLGKGCIRLRKSDPLPPVEAFLQRLVELRARGAETGC